MIAEYSPTRSLEDYRHEQLMSKQEFASCLGMTEKTYRRLLHDPQSVKPVTKRKAMENLGVTPYDVKEFYPLPSPTRQAAALAAYRRGNEHGWIATNPETGGSTGEVFDGNGCLIAFQKAQ